MGKKTSAGQYLSSRAALEREREGESDSDGVASSYNARSSWWYDEVCKSRWSCWHQRDERSTDAAEEETLVFISRGHDPKNAEMQHRRNLFFVVFVVFVVFVFVAVSEQT